MKKNIFALISIILLVFIGLFLWETEESESDETLSDMILDEVPQEQEEEFIVYEGDFELPIEGALGITLYNCNIHNEALGNSSVLLELKSGDKVKIISEEGLWLRVKKDNIEGWVLQEKMMINLPDVIPSIVYNNTNSYEAMFTSSGKAMEGVTGQVLYDAKGYNDRLDKDEYIVPVLYKTAKKVSKAQREALAQDEALVIYEGYRPLDTQKKILNALNTLAKKDKQVMAGINRAPWNTSWFINTGVSNHQKGIAIDLSLSSIKESEEKIIMGYKVSIPTVIEEYIMPTPMHELSVKAITFPYPVNSNSTEAWKEIPLAPTMNEPAIKLQSYCTTAGLTPLASEWWHFNDLEKTFN